MGFFDKNKTCSICGENFNLFGSGGKVLDGEICSKCSKKTSNLFKIDKNTSLEEIKNHLEYRAINENLFSKFNKTDNIENMIVIDRNLKMFYIPSLSFFGKTPDLFRFNQIVDYSLSENGITIAYKGQDMAINSFFTASRNGMTENMIALIKVKDALIERIEIPIIKSQTKRDSFTYKSKKENAKKLIMLIDSIYKDSAPLDVVPNNTNINKSVISDTNKINTYTSKEYTAQTEKVRKSIIYTEKLYIRTLTDFKNFKNYVVIDTETTGLSNRTDEIIEIGMVKIENGNIVDEYSTLIKPNCIISTAASKVNGIYDSDVKNAPSFNDVCNDIYKFINGNTIVAHNASFDISFLKRQSEECGIETDEIFYVDSIDIAKNSINNIANYKLDTIVKFFGLSEQNHRALDDARQTAIIVQKCIEKKIADHEEELQRKREEKKAKAIERETKFANSPLLNKKFAFTGDFIEDRTNLENMLSEVGAILQTSVNTNTDFLVVGNISNLPEWAIERKYGKAREIYDKKGIIKILSETKYLSMIENVKEQLK